MPTSLQTTPHTSFANIYNSFKETQGFFKKDGLSLRLSGDNLHTKSSKPSRWGEQGRIDRAKKRLAAKEFVTKALDKHLKKFGFSEGSGARLITSLSENGLIKSDRITIKDLKTITKHAERNISSALREKVIRFDHPDSKDHLRVAVNGSRDRMENFKDSGLDGLVDGAVWKMSDHGAGGAVMVTGQNDQKCILKFDGGAIEVAEKSYQLLDALRLNVNDPLPFVVPNMTVVDLEPESELRGKVDQKIETEITNLRDEIRVAKEKQKEGEKDGPELIMLKSKLHRMGGQDSYGVKKNLRTNPQVMKMEMVPNSKQLNLLDVNSKLALLKSEQFGQNIGKSMIIMQFLGFNDHLNIGSGGNTNFGNLMVNSEGHLHLIDPSMSYNEQTSNVGPSTPSLLAKMLDVLDVLAKCQSKEDAEKTIEDLLTKQEDRYKGEDSDGAGNPLGNLLTSVFGTINGGGSFFYKDPGTGEGVYSEATNRDNISPKDQKLFVANVVRGLLEGVHFLNRNRNQISESIENAGVSNYDSNQVLSQVNIGLEHLGQDRLNRIEVALQYLAMDLKDNV